MVNIENLGEGESHELKPILYESALEITHSALALRHTAVEGVYRLGCQTIDAGRDIWAFPIRICIEEISYAPPSPQGGVLR